MMGILYLRYLLLLLFLFLFLFLLHIEFQCIFNIIISRNDTRASSKVIVLPPAL